MSLATGLVSLGTTQGTALPITTAYAHFGTVASGTGAILPERTFREVYVRNAGANALLVYPPTGYTVDTGGLNAGSSVTAGTSARFVRDEAGGWWRFDK